VLAISVLAGTAACAHRDTRPRIAIDLVDGGVAFDAEGHRVHLLRAPPGAPRLLLQLGSGILDFYVRLPDRADFVVGLSPGTPAEALHVAATAGGALRELALRKGAGGEWSGAIEEAAGSIVRIRIENRATRPVIWLNPRVTGVDLPSPPVLDEALRSPRRPANVLLYVVDTLRADRLSLYGYERPTSPHLDELAKRSLVFWNAYAAGSYTFPSMVALFTSRAPSEVVRAKTWPGQTLAEAFAAAGYRTAGFQANPMLGPESQFARGFADYRVVKSSKAKTLPARAEELHAPLRAWLASARQPFFVYVQSMDVHFPYFPPSPHRERFYRGADPKTLPPEEAAVASLSPDLYDGCVARTDEALAELFSAMRDLGLADSTIVAITADHGEPLGQHGELLHGRTLFEEIVRVPLVVVLPWHTSGERVHEIVSLMDLGPTLLDLAGVGSSAHTLGQSLLQARNEPGPPVAVGEQFDLTKRTTLSAYARQGPWKLVVRRDGFRLFHLPSDAGELHDVSREQAFQTAYLATLVQRRVPGLRPDAGAPLPIDEGLSPKAREELERNLRSLGYVE
jgi:arylsulfatase A-like enzyme